MSSYQLHHVHGRVIPNDPEIPAHLRYVAPAAPSLVQPIVYRPQRAKNRERQKEALHAPLPSSPPPILHAHKDFYPRSF